VIKHVNEINYQNKNNIVSSGFYTTIKGEMNIFTKKTFQKISRIQNIALYGNKNFDTDSIYLRKSFSEEGDMIAHLNAVPPKHINDKVEIAAKNYDSTISLLNEFYAFAKSKKATVYLIYPPYPQSEYLKNKDAINFLHNQFKEKLNIPILATPEKFVRTDDCFFDTVYHLNKKGRAENTDTLISIIEKLPIKQME
jgi:hypothetical protein